MGFLKKLTTRAAWRRIWYERGSEPLHLNVFSLPVALFGSFRLKVEYDLIVRHYNAFGILKAADKAAEAGLPGVCVVEFGVATGAGLMNMCLIAQRVSALTGVGVTVVGFDTGTGMPAPRDYRDHPDLYQAGDFPGQLDRLREALPSNGSLVIGDLASTVPEFLRARMSEKCPIGYVMLDVDYYSSTVEALRLFEGKAEWYLPTTTIYVDDIHFESHNPYAGEQLAINEFNLRNEMRKICRHDFLEAQRLFRRAEWIRHMFTLHVLDHPRRTHPTQRPRAELSNPYL